MLVLTRRIGEQVIIDGNIVITILDIVGKQTRMGFDAPKDVVIHRKEIMEKIEKQKKDGVEDPYDTIDTISGELNYNKAGRVGGVL